MVEDKAGVVLVQRLMDVALRLSGGTHLLAAVQLRVEAL
jgi:hypothetical protein